MRTGIVKDDRYMEHDMGPFHPESPKRLEVIYRMLEEETALDFLEVDPRPAEEEEVERVHTASHFASIRATAGKERVHLDPDTSTCARSFEVALLAAGGLLEAADAVMEGKVENAFALIRPPGHHAEASQAMGFCIFNNAAVAAAHLLERHGLQRVLIVDWDLHHGNGTQHVFEDRPEVLYFSTHQFPHYPGTGHWSEVGKGKGEGFTVNIPLLSPKTDSDLLSIYRKVLRPVALEYDPQFILVSAGFDIYAGDPLGGMQVTETGFAALAGELLELAGLTCGNRILFTLEGGYNLQGLRDGVKEVLGRLSGTGPEPGVVPEPSPATERELSPVLETLSRYWSSLKR